MSTLRHLIFLCLLSAVGACKQQASSTPLAEPGPPQSLGEGLTYQLLATGSGAVARSGDKVTVHYVGTLETGKQFDSSRDRGRPFSFRLGRGQVIKGWDLGVEGMKEGERRRLVVPPSLGYGSSSSGPIPPNATLTFEVELVSVQ